MSETKTETSPVPASVINEGDVDATLLKRIFGDTTWLSKVDLENETYDGETLSKASKGYHQKQLVEPEDVDPSSVSLEELHACAIAKKTGKRHVLYKAS